MIIRLKDSIFKQKLRRKNKKINTLLVMKIHALLITRKIKIIVFSFDTCIRKRRVSSIRNVKNCKNDIFDPISETSLYLRN